MDFFLIATNVVQSLQTHSATNKTYASLKLLIKYTIYVEKCRLKNHLVHTQLHKRKYL